MAYVVGSPITGTIWLRDNGGSAITGLAQSDFATREAFDGGDVAATVTIAEIDAAAKPGGYRWAFTPTTSGLDWSLHVVYSGSGILWDGSAEFRVVTAAQADPVAALEGAEITVVSPISLTGDISVISGDAASIPWTSSDWDDLTSATVTFQAYKTITDTAVFDTPKSVTKTSVGGASQTVTLALLGTDTDDFTAGIAYRYEVNSTAGTLASGTLSAREG